MRATSDLLLGGGWDAVLLLGDNQYVDGAELQAKVLDGCAVNGHHWVYSAATMDVEYALTVMDTWTGRKVRYENPLGRRSPAVTDSSAFECP